MTAPLKTLILPAGAAATAEAARVLAAGGLVAFPTETVYGLGADATNGQAVARLYEAKGRPAFNPLIAHVTDLAAAQALARLDTDAERLAAALWPGPLTLVLPRVAGCPVAELANYAARAAGVDRSPLGNVEKFSTLIPTCRRCFSFSQTGMAMLKLRKPRGAKARYVSRIRSNLVNGLS